LSVPSATQDEAALVAWQAACERDDGEVALCAWLDDTGVALGSLEEAGEGAIALDDLLDLPTSVLLDPRLVGLDSGGIADALVATHAATPPELQALAVSRTVVAGRVAATTRFVTRFSASVRSLLPADHKVTVSATAADPATATWHAAAHPFAVEQVMRHALTARARADHGSAALLASHSTLAP
jgi:hypothetical protein